MDQEALDEQQQASYRLGETRRNAVRNAHLAGRKASAQAAHANELAVKAKHVGRNSKEHSQLTQAHEHATKAAHAAHIGAIEKVNKAKDLHVQHTESSVKIQKTQSKIAAQLTETGLLEESQDAATNQTESAAETAMQLAQNATASQQILQLR